MIIPDRGTWECFRWRQRELDRGRWFRQWVCQTLIIFMQSLAGGDNRRGAGWTACDRAWSHMDTCVVMCTCNIVTCTCTYMQAMCLQNHLKCILFWHHSTVRNLKFCFPTPLFLERIHFVMILLANLMRWWGSVMSSAVRLIGSY